MLRFLFVLTFFRLFAQNVSKLCCGSLVNQVNLLLAFTPSRALFGLLINLFLSILFAVLLGFAKDLIQRYPTVAHLHIDASLPTYTIPLFSILEIGFYIFPAKSLAFELLCEVYLAICL